MLTKEGRLRVLKRLPKTQFVDPTQERIPNQILTVVAGLFERRVQSSFLNGVCSCGLSRVEKNRISPREAELVVIVPMIATVVLLPL